MSLRGKLEKLAELARMYALQPRLTRRLLANLPSIVRGFSHGEHWKNMPLAEDPVPPAAPVNRLRAFAEGRTSGRGIWKWDHYFDIYERHFRKYVGREVHVLEVGVYSGGSLEMWRDYFGPQCHVYGFDVEAACTAYENEYTGIFIGDQADPDAWRAFRKRFPKVDILIDDGGHQLEQQIVTLEEMLPHLRPGGLYLCEDIYGERNGFAAYLQGLVNNLNRQGQGGWQPRVDSTGLQAWIGSAHFYPYATVLEKRAAPLPQLFTERHGTEWQPFM